VGRGGLWEKEKQIPVKIERDSVKPVVQKEAIPMGYTAQRDPKEPIPMGFERPSSAPAENQSSSPSIDRKLDPPKVPRPPTSSTGLGGPAKDSAGVHRVPIVVKNSDLPRSASAPPKPTEKSASPPILKPKTPLERIEEISSGVRDLESRINAFEGSRVDHEWRLLDELLTQAVLKLDTVPTDGVDEIRNARKVAVKYVHDLANFLEQKAKADRPKSKSPTAAGKSSSPGATTRIVIPMHPNARMGEKEIDL
jgi:BAG domain